jgi:hypothetical protein
MIEELESNENNVATYKITSFTVEEIIITLRF